MQIRQLKDEEKAQAQKLALEVFLNSGGLGYDEKGMHAVFNFIENEGSKFYYLGAFDEELVGLLAYDANYHLALCFVKNEVQGKGIGHQLLQAIIEQAKAAHVARVTVNSAPTATKVYEDFGFEVAGEQMTQDGVTVIPMEYLLGKEWLGQTVTVTVEHPIGTLHGLIADTLYTCNYGYVEEILKREGEFQDAYIVGPTESCEQFTGVVQAIIYRMGENEVRMAVTKQGDTSKEEIINAIAFQEQYHDTRLIWLS